MSPNHPSMTKSQILTLLEENQNARGIEHWSRRGVKQSKLKSYGIGLTQLRKLAKQLGRDHKLCFSCGGVIATTRRYWDY